MHYWKMQEGLLLFRNLVTMQARMKYMKGILFSIRKGYLFCQIGIEKSKGLDLRLEPLCTSPPFFSGSKYSDDCEFCRSNLIKYFPKPKFLSTCTVYKAKLGFPIEVKKNSTFVFLVQHNSCHFFG